MAYFDWLGLGNSTAGGWVAVALYALTTISCWLTARQAEHGTREKRLWWAMTVLLLALTINRQLDLQTVLTDFSRTLAVSEGWYWQRRPLQFELVVGVMAVCVAATVMLLAWAKRTPFAVRVALVGVVLVAGFVLIRAISFHYVDRFIGTRVLGVRLSWILEMSGVAMVLLASHWRRHHHSADNRRRNRGGTQ